MTFNILHVKLLWLQKWGNWQLSVWRAALRLNGPGFDSRHWLLQWSMHVLPVLVQVFPQSPVSPLALDSPDNKYDSLGILSVNVKQVAKSLDVLFDSELTI